MKRNSTVGSLLSSGGTASVLLIFNGVQVSSVALNDIRKLKKDVMLSAALSGTFVTTAAAGGATGVSVLLLPPQLASSAAVTISVDGVQLAQAMLDAADTLLPLPSWFKATLPITAIALVSANPADSMKARAMMLCSMDGGGPLAAIGAPMELAALGETALALDVTEALLLWRGPLIAGTGWQSGQVVHHDVRHRFTNHRFLPVCVRYESRHASPPSCTTSSWPSTGSALASNLTTSSRCPHHGDTGRHQLSRAHP